ncbi:acyl carrier protein [Micromonospora sp. RTGN7]|uniref:acyl carrier protein n=1 Tax=Micromonospora sp. RTGN7 TaxID=3016526 RepID=UPI0029FF525E|nr:acyl carrier protein [Micromonospora sp. RTGN7]
MNTDQIRAELAGIFEEVAGVPDNDVQLDKSLREDLDVDSLSMVEIMVVVEEKFGVSLPDELAAELRTVGDLVSYIQQHAPAASAS